MSSRGQPSRKKSPLLIRSIEHVLPVNAVLIIAKFAIFPSFSFASRLLTVSVMNYHHTRTIREQLKEFSVKFRIATAKNRLTTSRSPRWTDPGWKLIYNVLETKGQGEGGKSRNLVKSEARGSRVLARVLQFIASFLRVKAYYEPHT